MPSADHLNQSPNGELQGTLVAIPALDQELKSLPLTLSEICQQPEQQEKEQFMSSASVLTDRHPYVNDNELNSNPLAKDLPLRVEKQSQNPPEENPSSKRQINSSTITNESVPGNSSVAADNSNLNFTPSPQLDPSLYQPLDCWDTPVEMLAFVDPRFQVNEQTHKSPVELYDWQLETLVFLALGGRPEFTDRDPLMFNLCACNGSGKDAYVIAPLAVWLAISKIRHRIIITSSSFDQLTSQTESHIRYVVDQVNRWAVEHVGGKILVYKQFHVVALNTRSEIKMFAKDDPGRVEGYHPFPDYSEAGMCVIVNEAKTVEEGIQNAMKRFTGFSRWINISSSGRTSGPFYKGFLASKPWAGITGYDRNLAYSRKVTAYDCKHISSKTIESARKELGEGSSLFRSIYLSEFTSLEESVMISREALDKCLKKSIPHLLSIRRSAGLDLALGGDETSCYLTLGNKVIDKLNFRDKDAVNSSGRILMQLESWKAVYDLKPDEVYADDGGLGRSIIDMLKDKGWDGINRILNNSPARFKANFGNRGAEMWFRIKRMLEEGLLILDPSDTILIDQLGQRYYRESDTNSKLYLESKQEARAKGHCSPDRADAFVLALCNLDLEELQQAAGIAKIEQKDKSPLLNRIGGLVRANKGQGLTYEQLEEFRDRRALGQKDADNASIPMDTIHSSLSVLINKLHGRQQIDKIRFRNRL